MSDNPDKKPVDAIKGFVGLSLISNPPKEFTEAWAPKKSPENTIPRPEEKRE